MQYSLLCVVSERVVTNPWTTPRWSQLLSRSVSFCVKPVHVPATSWGVCNLPCAACMVQRLTLLHLSEQMKRGLQGSAAYVQDSMLCRYCRTLEWCKYFLHEANMCIAEMLQGSGWFRQALCKDAPAWQSTFALWAFRSGRSKQLRYQVCYCLLPQTFWHRLDGKPIIIPGQLAYVYLRLCVLVLLYHISVGTCITKPRPAWKNMMGSAFSSSPFPLPPARSNTYHAVVNSTLSCNVHGLSTYILIWSR